MMSDKPQRIRVIHVPIYDTDDIVLNQMPPNAVNQWARTLILRQLQLDAQMMHSFRESGGEEVAREEVTRVIQDELEPILARLDDTMDRVIDEKLVLVQQTVMQTIQESIQVALVKHAENPSFPSQQQLESADPAAESGDKPAWMRATGTGSEW